MDKELTIKYQEYDSIAELNSADQELMQQAIKATEGAYAPYSHFKVGAALRLSDGTVVTDWTEDLVVEDADVVLRHVDCNAEGQLCEASPCGACRQVLLEYEQQQKHGLRVLCLLGNGRLREVKSIASLLPFSFEF